MGFIFAFLVQISLGNDIIKMNNLNLYDTSNELTSDYHFKRHIVTALFQIHEQLLQISLF